MTGSYSDTSPHEVSEYFLISPQIRNSFIGLKSYKTLTPSREQPLFEKLLVSDFRFPRLCLHLIPPPHDFKLWIS